jgi:hypothetical protein
MQSAKITKRKRGFFTIAQNNDTCDYVRLAYGLALSLRHSQIDTPYLSIGITPGTVVPDSYAWAFDNIIEIPWGDHATASQWKLENEWKVIHMTPYDETRKLDSDMLFFNDINLWWDMLSTSDFSACNRILNYRAETVENDFYRKTFTENQLPNVYTAFMYFKKTTHTFEIFELAKFIYFNWEAMFEENLLPEYRPDHPSTDVIFAIALKLLDLDQRSYTVNQLPTFTHMKSQLQGWGGHDMLEDWTQHMSVFFNPSIECKIGNYLQFFPLHYHVKTFLTDEMLEYYERSVKR